MKEWFLSLVFVVDIPYLMNNFNKFCRLGWYSQLIIRVGVIYCKDNFYFLVKFWYLVAPVVNALATLNKFLLVNMI